MRSRMPLAGSFGFRKGVAKLTDLHGLATFSIIGAASPSECPSEPPGCATVYADGIILGSTSVAVLDLDGIPGLGGGDVAEWLGGYLCGSGSPRLDYNGSGVDGGDLSLLLASFFSGRSAIGCSAALCK